jgi:hypothetical protein
MLAHPPGSFGLVGCFENLTIAASGFLLLAADQLSGLAVRNMVAMRMIASVLTMPAGASRVAALVQSNGVLFVFAVANDVDDGLGGIDEVAGQDGNGFVGGHFNSP